MKRWKSTLAALLAVLMIVGLAIPAAATPPVIFRTIGEIAGTQAESFSFVLSGDPQLGASGNLASDRAGWQDSLTKAAAWEDVAFLITAGDNINNGGSAEEFVAFQNPIIDTGLVLAPTQGNHDKDIYDWFTDSLNRSLLPNLDSYGNYYYTYGGALFMHVNNSEYKPGGFTKIAFFMIKTVLCNRDASWKFVTFHKPLYSAAAGRAVNYDIILRRIAYVPLFDLLGIDMSMSGHDHIYVRTKPMRLQIPCKSGTTYITANSGSGSKHYDMMDWNFLYADAQLQLRVPTLSKIDVTPAALTLTTYRMDTLEAVDSCVIAKCN